MSVTGLTTWNRIQAFICALLSAVILIVYGLSSFIFGYSYLDFVQTYFITLVPATQAMIIQIMDVMLWISSFAGWVVLIAAFLILAGKTTIARLILFITVGIGTFAFALPFFIALFHGLASLEIALDSVATKYAVAALLALLARSYARKS